MLSCVIRAKAICIFYVVSLSILFFFTVIDAQSQNHLTTNDKQAMKLFQSAKICFDNGDYPKCISLSKRSIKRDQNFLESYILIAEAYTEMGQFAAAISYFEHMIQRDSGKYPEALLTLGNLNMRIENYSGAKSLYERYKKIDPTTDLSEKIALCEYRDYLISNPIPSILISLGDSVNTPHNSEYVNAITLDGKTLYYTVKPERDAEGSYAGVTRGKFDEDFYYAKKQMGEWRKGVPLPDPINSPFNEGAMFLSSDENLLFFSSCQREDGYGSCDLYSAIRINDTLWENPTNLGEEINTASWESQPSFSSDGKTLYFSSNRIGGWGKSDIWQAELSEEGRWRNIKNLGHGVNTEGEEMAPYIHPDGKTLFFSSNGHRGMGGMDIFVVRKKSDGSWGEPQNIGYPINTRDDQMNIVVEASGEIAYISSVDTVNGVGNYDIFKFELPLNSRPMKVGYLKGEVCDGVSKEPLRAKILLKDLKTDQLQSYTTSLINGRFSLPIPSKGDFALHVTKRGYLFYSENISLHDSLMSSNSNIELFPIEKGAKVLLRNIFFAFDSHEMLPESLPELKQLLIQLKENEEWDILVVGHTDDVGSDAYNMQLSEKRALEIRNYLVEQGIDALRMEYKGMGKSESLYPNTTDWGRAQNRRTEIIFNPRKK